MKAIQFTGLRLGATYEGWPEDGSRIRQRQRDLLAELFDVAEESQASLLISTGDLFDAPNVPLEEVECVLELCRQHPMVTLAALPGGRDPWGAYTVYHHLKGAELSNLIVLSPQQVTPFQPFPDTWIYALPADSTSDASAEVKDMIRRKEGGYHLAVVYGSMARFQAGPEAGLVMISPSVATHSFDWLALADGKSSERIGSELRPATYAGPLVPDGPGPRDRGSVWSIRFGAEAPEVESVRIQSIHQVEMTIDLGEHSNTAAVASRIRREADSSSLISVTLTGVRAADRPILAPSLIARCAGSFLGFRVVDDSVIGPPSADQIPTTLVSVLWNNYQQSPPEDRGMWADALRLYASGVTDPQAWKEAPWAR